MEPGDGFGSQLWIEPGERFAQPALGQQEETLRQRLREWYYPAQEKSGTHRRTLAVETCFAPLLGWVLAWWPEEHQELALALDATTLGQRFTVLCISVLVRGCAIPVAWKVLAYNQRDPGSRIGRRCWLTWMAR